MTRFGEKEYLTAHSQEDSMLLMRVKLNMVQVKDNYGYKGVCRVVARKKQQSTLDCVPKYQKEQ